MGLIILIPGDLARVGDLTRPGLAGNEGGKLGNVGGKLGNVGGKLGNEGGKIGNLGDPGLPRNVAGPRVRPKNTCRFPNL